ncbi:ABC transporter permease [Alteromonas alba]|uniref:ABC transporter permease n=1 Tax=Alteromonas alba TaxID=2079529 RepID=A0A2S9V7D4_9ALTE|nr:ABC transporter permease subunit [Alteromonas alba]MCP4864919.1 ABC transporter permease subunit [Alteromonas sp.]PRO72342.1 ABC transporter permease [Alteromonas alba]HAU94221.1 ABC transporter permease [Alteromonas sp.]|tara:strand:+ start:13523 stop:14257 length:735 start_codon:yes stop_codon:yes gene_type:complete
MGNIWIVTKREFASFFATPVAYVFIAIFLMLSGIFTFFIGNLYERGQADLIPFFNFHPWLYLFLVPAIAMRSWAEERKSGSIELLMTLPISVAEAVLGKFIAAWLVLGLALALTFPLWLSVDFLGEPDHGIIVAAYIGSWLMAGAFLAISTCMSAFTRNQVVAFILAVVVCFLFVVSGSSIVLDAFQPWAGNLILDTVASFSFLSHFEAMAKGVLALNDVGYFFIIMVVWLYASLIVIEQKKAD